MPLSHTTQTTGRRAPGGVQRGNPFAGARVTSMTGLCMVPGLAAVARHAKRGEHRAGGRGFWGLAHLSNTPILGGVSSVWSRRVTEGSPGGPRSQVQSAATHPALVDVQGFPSLSDIIMI